MYKIIANAKTYAEDARKLALRFLQISNL